MPTSLRSATARHRERCSGAATRRGPGQQFTLPDAPIAYDLDAAGSLGAEPARSASTAVRWDELPSLYGQGSAEVFAARLEPDGGLTVDLRRRSAGRAAADRPRQRDGDVPGRRRHAPARSSRARSTPARERPGREEGRGRRADERRRRPGRRAPICDARPRRALGPSGAPSRSRTSSISALAYPGVTHAAAWSGAGPPGCACGGSGLHLAFVRAGTAGPRAPQPAEVALLSSASSTRAATRRYRSASARRAHVAVVSSTVDLAADPRREVAGVVAAVAVRAARSPTARSGRSSARSASRSIAATSSPCSTRRPASSASEPDACPAPAASSAGAPRSGTS